MKNPLWKDKISNPQQIGGIETSVLDNGPGRGVRIAWINTGTGLRYKVVIDKGMDIAEAFFNEHSLAWISHAGVMAPQPFSNQGMDWLRTFGGGLLTTCGLSHIGGPESDERGTRGLHGNYSNSPAEIIEIVQPDPVRGKMEMRITGIVRESTVFGPSLELKRTISGILGQPFIKVKDEVTNMGNTPAPHMLLYHINCGWPLIDVGSDIIWSGKWQTINPETDNRIFNSENNYKKCPAPIDAHQGKGEEAAFITPHANQDGHVKCGFLNQTLGFGLKIKYDSKQLPWLINWQHWGKGEYVTALEPATNPPIGQAKARKESTLIEMEPHEKRTYELELAILTDHKQIEDFLKINN